MAALTKEKVKEFRSDFDTVSKLFENKYGIKLDLGTIRFDSSSFRTTMTGLVMDPVGEAARSVNTDLIVSDGLPSASPTDAAGLYISTMAKANGLTLEMSPKGFIGSIYRLPGKRNTYEITGINRRAPKYCVEVITSSGTRYKMPINGLRSAVLVGHK